MNCNSNLKVTWSLGPELQVNLKETIQIENAEHFSLDKLASLINNSLVIRTYEKCPIIKPNMLYTTILEIRYVT
jgi:hypothetical protein